MLNILLVGIGGFIGSIARYLASGYVQQITQSIGFPYGTLAVNLIGCFVIGVLAELADARGVFTTESRAFVFVGILGGFTTFSSFGNETMNLMRDGETLPAFANVSVHIILGLGMVWLGRLVAHAIWG
ncbi:MAG: fluoride efflux transporter CrcB [Chloroflexi bacterium]|nr:fluoride efflux transporter CrcB [Chloroflexota bacterium]